MARSKLNKLGFIICLLSCIGLYVRESIAYSRSLALPNFFQYPSNLFLKYNSNDLFQYPLFYQNLPLMQIQQMNFCDFVMYGDDIKIRWIIKQIFGFLPDHISHLPISYSEKDFSIEYWIHESTPEVQRHFIYQVIEETNIELGFHAFRIAGIDSNEIDSIDNRKDQRNVIYLLDEEEMSTLLSAFAYIPGQAALQSPALTIQVPNLNVLHPLPYPIIDADIIINTNITTDLEAFRAYLADYSEQLGIENPPSNTYLAYLHNLLIWHLETIDTDAEEHRRLLIEVLTQRRQMTEQYLNAIRNNIGLTEEEERNFHQSFVQADRNISRLASVAPSSLLRSIEGLKKQFTAMDVTLFQDSSSVFF